MLGRCLDFVSSNLRNTRADVTLVFSSTSTFPNDYIDCSTDIFLDLDISDPDAWHLKVLHDTGTISSTADGGQYSLQLPEDLQELWRSLGESMNRTIGSFSALRECKTKTDVRSHVRGFRTKLRCFMEMMQRLAPRGQKVDFEKHVVDQKTYRCHL